MDTESTDTIQTAAVAMAGDSGWIIVATEDAEAVTRDEFDSEGQTYFREAEARGVSMVVFAYAVE